MALPRRKPFQTPHTVVVVVVGVWVCGCVWVSGLVVVCVGRRERGVEGGVGWGGGGGGADGEVNVASLSITHHSVHLIMGAVSLWTRPPALCPMHRAPKSLPLISVSTARDAWPPAEPALTCRCQAHNYPSGQTRIVDLVVRHLHHSERGSLPGSHVTDRGCRMRPGNLRQRRRPHPRRRAVRLRSPWGFVPLGTNTTAVMKGCGQGHLDAHLLTSQP